MPRWYSATGTCALADLEGAYPAHAPQGSRFFRFDIQIFWKLKHLGSPCPPYEVHAPPMGNHGSTTDVYTVHQDWTCVPRCIMYIFECFSSGNRKHSSLNDYWINLQMHISEFFWMKSFTSWCKCFCKLLHYIQTRKINQTCTYKSVW